MLWSLDRLLGSRKSTRMKSLESREMKGDYLLILIKRDQKRACKTDSIGRVKSIRTGLRVCVLRPPDPATTALLHGEVKVAAELWHSSHLADCR